MGNTNVFMAEIIIFYLLIYSNINYVCTSLGVGGYDTNTDPTDIVLLVSTPISYPCTPVHNPPYPP